MTSITDRLVEMTPGGRIPFKLQFAALAVVFVVMLLANVASAAAQVSGPIPSGTMGMSEANWHLLTLSHGGTVSLVHGLTKEACEKARTLALDILSIDARGNFTSRTVHVTSGTIIRAECFQ